MITNAKKLSNFTMIFGAPGSGKTTIATCIAIKARKRGYQVYTNFPVPGCLKINFSDIGKYSFHDSLCIIDEAGIEASNRDWKSIPKNTIDYLKMARHRSNQWIFLSQGWDDADKKIRGLCSAYYKLKKIGVFTICREMRRDIDIDEVTHQPTDMYYRVPIIRRGLSIVYRKRWYRYFDSWDAPPLPDAPVIPW